MMKTIAEHRLRQNPQTFALILSVAVSVVGFLVSTSSAEAADCANPRALGLERTVTVDTAGGPMYGHQQYKDIDFLKPKEVVLTFDDGPLRRNTRAVLEALEAHCTKATFFMVGRQAVADPKMVKEVASAGHTIALHTWSHLNLATHRTDRAIAEIELGLSAVKAAAGDARVLPFFRFPYLSDPKRMKAYLKARDIATFSIDVDSYDYRTRSGSEVHRKIMSQLESRGQRGILLFHDIQSSTARGLKPLLDDLAKNGYKIVHMSSSKTVQSLPEYDEEAKRLLEKRSYTVASKPLVTRTFTWQMPAPGEDDNLADRVRKSRTAGSQSPTGPTPQPAATPAPAQQGSTPDVPPTIRSARPVQETDWRRAIFER